MRFYEYESKALFAKRGLPLGKAKVVNSAAEAQQAAKEIGGPVVLKSQVLSGGRMKAGAVKFADSPEEAAAHFDAILPIEVNGQKARSVLVEEKTPIAQEYFVSVTWDGRAKKPVVLFSDMGGIDIEEVAESNPDAIATEAIDIVKGIDPAQTRRLAEVMGFREELIPDAQHAPALENPSFVADTIIKFTKEKAWQKKAVAA